MYDRMINELNSELKQMQGIEPEHLFDYYKKYVDNTVELRKMISMGFFRFEYLRIDRVFKGTIFEDGMNLIIGGMRLAMQSHKEECLPFLNDFSLCISRGCTSRTQLCMLRSQERPDRLDLYAKEGLHEIAETIENTLQPYIVMLYQLTRIATGKSINHKAKLGTIIRELVSEKEEWQTLYKDLTMGVNVAKWRNAYDHGDYYINGDRVIIQFEELTKSIDRQELDMLLAIMDMLVFMHKISYMLFMVDYGEYIDRSQLQNYKGKDSITDNVVIHIAEVSAMYNCKLDYFLQEEQVVIISMMDDCVPHENIDKMLQIVFALTECSYDILVCYDEKVRYAASNTDSGMVCNVFGKIEQ